MDLEINVTPEILIWSYSLDLPNNRGCNADIQAENVLENDRPGLRHSGLVGSVVNRLDLFHHPKRLPWSLLPH